MLQPVLYNFDRTRTKPLNSIVQETPPPQMDEKLKSFRPQKPN